MCSNSMCLSACIDEIDSAELRGSKAVAWQTLKDTVLSQQSNNIAMVPCPGHKKGNMCEIHAHDWLCGDVECMLSVSQHQ